MQYGRVLRCVKDWHAAAQHLKLIAPYVYITQTTK